MIISLPKKFLVKNRQESTEEIEKLTYRNHVWWNLSSSMFALLHTITKQSIALRRCLKQKYCCRVESQQDALIFVDRKTKNGYNGLRRLFKVSGESPDVVHLLRTLGHCEDQIGSSHLTKPS